MANRLAELNREERGRLERNPGLPGMHGDLAEPRPPRRRLASALALPVRALGRAATSDAGLVAGGLALAAICAVFPWYIFLHQDRFGIRPLEFKGTELTPSLPAGKRPPPVGARIATQRLGPADLDMIPTGTVDRKTTSSPPTAAEQPFPGETADFRLVHVAGNRAMIEDGSGFWVVQRGSRLPDGSRMASIEKRDGQWVLVTSRQAVIPVTP